MYLPGCSSVGLNTSRQSHAIVAAEGIIEQLSHMCWTGAAAACILLMESRPGRATLLDCMVVAKHMRCEYSAQGVICADGMQVDISTCMMHHSMETCCHSD